jgi:hypothetical protein
MGLFDKDALKGGFMATMVIDVIRGMLNRALKETTPQQLVEAIKTDTSLWGTVEGDIMSYTDTLPPFVSSGIKEARSIVETQYGGFDKIVMIWLKEDHPVYYNIVNNLPEDSGKIWLKKQVNEILDGVQNANGK